MVNQVTCNNSQMLEIFIYVSVFFFTCTFLVFHNSQHKFILRLVQGFLKNVQLLLTIFLVEY